MSNSVFAEGVLNPFLPAPKPFLKWVGGKRQVLDQILPLLPEFSGDYYEVFVGGGALFFALKPARAHLSDANAELISAYIAIRNDVEEVIRALGTYTNDAERFYAVRAIDWRDLGTWDAAARMIYLNKTCFNGLYRVNAKGGFNCPFGRFKNPKICDVENLRAVSEALRYVSLDCCDYRVEAALATAGDLVYFDPPYTPVSTSASFTAYVPGGFGWNDQVRLAGVFRAATDRGAFCALSQADLPQVRELYSGFAIHEIKARRNVNCDSTKRGVVGEILVTSF